MEDIFQFRGRGTQEIEADSIFVIEAEVGTVLGVIIRVGVVDFRKCYCRRALADRWGVYLDHPFCMRSSPDLRRSWAECVSPGAFVFRQVSFQLEREAEWMRNRKT
jgi:hypothetical protein